MNDPEIERVRPSYIAFISSLTSVLVTALAITALAITSRNGIGSNSSAFDNKDFAD